VVRIVYFSWVREQVGLSQEELDLPATIVTAEDLAIWLAGRGGGYGSAFADLTKLRCAVDQTMIALSDPLGQATEIAFFPPVTGG
jgi:sulfur-carrier protein